MVRINGNSGSTPNWKAETVEQAEGSGELQQLENQLDEAIASIEELDRDYLTDEQIEQLERLKATMMAEKATIDAYQSGVVPGSTGGVSGTGADYFSGDNLSDLGSGWSSNALISDRAEHESAMLPEDGEYMGTITVDNYGGEQTNPLGLSVDAAFEEELMGPGGVIDEVNVSSRGKDLVFTIIGHDANGAELRFSWVFVNGTVNSTPIIINATELSHGVKIDCSHAFRISDGNFNSLDGVARGFYIWGTEYEDVIIGSQGADKISAQGGDDFIDGMAGNDTLYGDYVGDQLATGGGDDTIRGGAGNDILYGGTSSVMGDTRYDSDSTSATNPESVAGFENVIDDVAGAAPDPDDWLIGTGWDWSTDDGEVIIEQTDPSAGGSIEINLEDMQADGSTFNMVVAEVRDGTDLVLNVIGEGPNGEPVTFKIVIKDFMRAMVGYSPEQIVKLTVNGTDASDIIDFSKVEGITSQVINLNGFGGDDILINPEMQALADGLAFEDMTSSSEAPSTIRSYVENDGIFYDPETGNTDEYNGYSAVYDDTSREIQITETGPHDDSGLQIVAPEGYDHGYIAIDPATGDYLIIMVKSGSDPDTIVIRVPAQYIDETNGLYYNNIYIANLDESPYDEENESWQYSHGTNWGLMPISIDPADYVIDGGDGNDIAYGLRGTKFEDVEQEIEGDTELQQALEEQENAPVPEIETE